jgi:hypothetical protein
MTSDANHGPWHGEQGNAYRHNDGRVSSAAVRHIDVELDVGRVGAPVEDLLQRRAEGRRRRGGDREDGRETHCAGVGICTVAGRPVRMLETLRSSMVSTLGSRRNLGRLWGWRSMIYVVG